MSVKCIFLSNCEDLSVNEDTINRKTLNKCPDQPRMLIIDPFEEIKIFQMQ